MMAPELGDATKLLLSNFFQSRPFSGGKPWNPRGSNFFHGEWPRAMRQVHAVQFFCLYGRSQIDGSEEKATYHLVNVFITMEHQHFSWESTLFLRPFSIAILTYPEGIYIYIYI